MDNENLLLNPIDIVEDVIHQKKWNFSRAADHELVAEISSQWCPYRLYFTWSENINALSLSITFDIRFPETKLNMAYELLGLINENLWIGHFDITSRNGIPAFRHTLIRSSEDEMLYKKLEDLVDIAVYECEKYYPAFQLILFDEASPDEALNVCNFDTIGRA